MLLLQYQGVLGKYHFSGFSVSDFMSVLNAPPFEMSYFDVCFADFSDLGYERRVGEVGRKLALDWSTNPASVHR